jgi:hypothetical protein
MNRVSTLSMVAGMLLLGSAAIAGAPQVDVCHIPPGNPSNQHIISVGPSAVPAHLAHGDTLGKSGGCEPVSHFCTRSIQPCGAGCL